MYKNSDNVCPSFFYFSWSSFFSIKTESIISYSVHIWHCHVEIILLKQLYSTSFSWTQKKETFPFICIFSNTVLPYLHTVLVRQNGPKLPQRRTKPLCQLFSKHHCPQNSCITQHNLLALWAQKGFSALNVSLCFSAKHLPSVWVRCRGSFGWTRLFWPHPSDQTSWPFGFSV